MGLEDHPPQLWYESSCYRYQSVVEENTLVCGTLDSMTRLFTIPWVRRGGGGRRGVVVGRERERGGEGIWREGRGGAERNKGHCRKEG